jgi:hypothetical protein
MVTQEFILNSKNFYKYNVDNFCYKCKENFKLKDNIVSKTSSGKVKRYHKKCYESLFI